MTDTNVTRRRPMSEINVVPYIDVMLVLLVIFMATAPLLTQGVLVDLPQARSDPITDTADDPLVVSIRADGAIFVNLGIRNAEEEGTRVTVYSLEDQSAKILRARPDVPVYVKADHRLDYGMVVRVMSVLQKAGAERVGLITDPVDIGARGDPSQAKSLQPGSARGHPSQEMAQPGSARGHPSQEMAQPGSARGHPSQEMAQPGSARGHPSQEMAQPGSARGHPSQEMAQPGSARGHPSQTIG